MYNIFVKPFVIQPDTFNIFDNENIWPGLKVMQQILAYDREYLNIQNHSRFTY